tara:strand:+ start:919 stop:1053 length:135 start_codon:yes stop_codon:yes gene_type:complete
MTLSACGLIGGFGRFYSENRTVGKRPNCVEKLEVYARREAIAQQ